MKGILGRNGRGQSEQCLIARAEVRPHVQVQLASRPERAWAEGALGCRCRVHTTILTVPRELPCALSALPRGGDAWRQSRWERRVGCVDGRCAKRGGPAIGQGRGVGRPRVAVQEGLDENS
eukprot:scaffold98698_cov29-Tisochrysis_lutea.AAC.2